LENLGPDHGGDQPRARDERPFAWVSLDAGDNDPVALVAAVLAALDQVLGLADALGGAQAVREPPHEEFELPSPGSACFDAGRAFVLVLDDLHLVSDELSLAAIGYLAERLPAAARGRGKDRATGFPQPYHRVRDRPCDPQRERKVFHDAGRSTMGNTGSTQAGFSEQARLDTSQVADLRGGGGRFGGVPSGRMTIVGWGISLAFNAWDVCGTHDRSPGPREKQISHEMHALRSRTRAVFDVNGTQQNGAMR